LFAYRYFPSGILKTPTGFKPFRELALFHRAGERNVS
jgi:hypothetical protein